MSSELLQALGSTGDIIASIDFETFYDSEYTLKKLTTEGYVRDPRFQVLGVGVKWGDAEPVWLEEWEFREWAARVNWSRVAVNAHHTQFDGLILSHHYGIKPGFLYCTMSMARGIHGVSRVGLDYLAPKYGLGEKGDDLVNAKGLRREQMTQAAWHRLGAYCKQDVRLTAGLLERMRPELPPLELWLIDTTVRFFTEPSFVGNREVLEKSLKDEREKKAVLLDRVHELTGEDAKTVLGSNDKFAALLRTLGHEPATKPNAKGDGENYAFAKTDPPMKAMLESEIDDIWFLAEARLSVKSTIVETRTERMLGVASRGRVPFYLKYCFAAGTLVLTSRGWTAIEALRPRDLLWDGEAWVSHGGLVDQGEQETWKAHGLEATSNHEIWTGREWTPWGDLLNDPTGSLFRSALSSARLPFSTGDRTKHRRAGASGFNLGSNAPTAVGAGSFIDDTSGRTYGLAAGAPNAASGLESSSPNFYPTRPSANESCREFTACSPDASTPSRRLSQTTEVGASLCIALGSRTRPISFATSEPPTGGIGPNSTLTVSTTTAGTNPATFDSLAAPRTARTNERSQNFSDALTISKRRTRVFDIYLSGPKNRFTVHTDRGPVVVHNCGAHTHRWSGGDKMNPQNFNRGGQLRAAIEAPPGEELVVVDSGQIEARVLGWLAGDRALLDVFRENDAKGEAGDFYSDMGTRFFFLRPISKKETPVERQLSKNMALGLGFGMGWGKFATELLKGMLGSKPVQFGLGEAQRFGIDVAEWLASEWGRSGVPNSAKVDELRDINGISLELGALQVHCAVAAHFVNVYRRASPKIVELWRAFSSALPVMADPTDDEGRVRMKVGPISVIRHGLVKPGGMALHYPGLREVVDGYVYQGGKSGREVTRIYGGLVTENVVQSLARDIVAEQVLWTRADLGPECRVATTTHDEGVSRVPAGQGAAAFEQAKRRFCTPPTWCADLPLNASGGFAVSYGAVK